MQRFAAVVSTLAVLVSAANVSGQQTPNFAGTWALVAPADAPAGGAVRGGGGGGGGRVGGGGGGGGARGGRGGGFGGGALAGLGMGGAITQDASTLTITRTTQAGEIKTVYRLDGSESKNSATLGANTIESVSKARWEGAKLVVVTTTTVQGNAVETTTSYSMDGANLVVESTGMGRGGATAVTTTMRYTKG